MDWFQQYDDYCERLDLSFWSEPVNAVTNLSFILVALIMWRRSRGVPLARALAGIEGVIGIGSFLYHTFATRWAEVADTVPILAYVLVFIFALGRELPGMFGARGPRWLWALGLVALFFPFARATFPLFDRIEAIGTTAYYMPIPAYLAMFIALTAAKAPALARDLGIGLGLMLTSMVFRSLDLPLCDSLPLGTHFLWHVLNGIMLGWMIEAYRRHALEAARAAR